jgi:Protein of unknown function (DUF3237)
MSADRLPEPRLTRIYRLEATLGARRLDWLNKGVFISVGGRQADDVIYETYLVE